MDILTSINSGHVEAEIEPLSEDLLVDPSDEAGSVLLCYFPRISRDGDEVLKV